MIVNHKPKPKEISEEEHREHVLAELSKESTAVLNLALMYAQTFRLTGQDITKKWESAYEQYVRMQDVYNMGYEDGIHERGRRVNDKGRSEEGTETD